MHGQFSLTIALISSNLIIQQPYSRNNNERIAMPVIKKLTMFSVAVKDMPKATAFYADKLGLEVTQDYRQDEKHWWITLALPEGGVSITLSLDEEGIAREKLGVYFSTDDIKASHKELSDMGVKVSDIQNDLYGPGSGVKFISLEDADGNSIIISES